MIRLNDAGLKFDPLMHYYEDSEGRPLLSVTELLKKHGLGRDFRGIRKEVLSAAADRGTAIHRLCEDYDNGIRDVESPYMTDLVSYLSLKKENGLVVERSEYQVCNDVCAGSIDKVMSDGSIGDIKTCSALDRDSLKAYRWQLSLYGYLCRHLNPGMAVPHLYIIWIRGEKYRLVEVPPVPDAELEHLLECERLSTPDNPVRYAPLSDLDSEPHGAVSQEKARKYLEFEAEISRFDEIIRNLKAERDALGLCGDMMAAHEPFTICGDAKISLVEGQVRQSIDSKKLKETLPDVYAEYLRTAEVKPFIKVSYSKKQS